MDGSYWGSMYHCLDVTLAIGALIYIAMTELVIQFLVIWLVLLVIVKYLIGWPKELDEIRSQYPTRLVIKGLISPKTVIELFSAEQLQVFKKFRLIYFSAVALLVIGIASVALYVDYRVQAESPLFGDQEIRYPD